MLSKAQRIKEADERKNYNIEKEFVTSSSDNIEQQPKYMPFVSYYVILLYWYLKFNCNLTYLYPIISILWHHIMSYPVVLFLRLSYQELVRTELQSQFRVRHTIHACIPYIHAYIQYLSILYLYSVFFIYLFFFEINSNSFQDDISAFRYKELLSQNKNQNEVNQKPSFSFLTVILSLW